MLDLNSSRIYKSEMANLHSTVSSVEEGTALVTVMENGIAVVKPAAGIPAERFVGLALSQVINAAVAPVIETIVVPTGGGVVTLVANPIGVPAVRQGGTAFAKDPAATAGKFIHAGRKLTFAAADAGKTLTVLYDKELTVLEAQTLYGQGILDGAQSVIQATGVVTQAEAIFTTLYDKDSNWWAENPGAIYTAADGKLSLDDSGSMIAGAYVVHAPTPTSPFLGIHVNV